MLINQNASIRESGLKPMKKNEYFLRGGYFALYFGCFYGLVVGREENWKKCELIF